MTKKEMLENTYIYLTPVTKEIRLCIAKKTTRICKTTKICDEYRVLEKDEVYSILCMLIDYLDSKGAKGCIAKCNASGFVKYRFSKEQIEVKDD